MWQRGDNRITRAIFVGFAFRNGSVDHEIYLKSIHLWNKCVALSPLLGQYKSNCYIVLLSVVMKRSSKRNGKLS